MQERDRVRKGESAGTIFILEHDPPVITLGRRCSGENILVSGEELASSGYQVRETGRGGDVTVHEPGQVIAYFVLPLGSKDAGMFVSRVMTTMSDFLNKYFSVNAPYDPSRPGLWTDGEKLCSVGFDLTGGVSMHGIALNVSNSLKGFSLIVPCGMSNVTMTTLSRAAGSEIDSGRVASELALYLEREFI